MFPRNDNDFNQFKYACTTNKKFIFTFIFDAFITCTRFVPSIKCILTTIEHSLCNSCLFTYFLWTNDLYIRFTGRINKIIGCYRLETVFCIQIHPISDSFFFFFFFLFTRLYWALVLSYDWLNESMFQEYDDDGKAQAIEPDATARYILSQNPGPDKC